MLLEKVKDFSFAVQPYYYNNMAVTLQMFLDEIANDVHIEEDLAPFAPPDVQIALPQMGISPPNELPFTIQADLGFLHHLAIPLLATQGLPASVPSPNQQISPPDQQISPPNQQASPSNPQISPSNQDTLHSSQSSAPITGSINQILTNILSTADDIVDQTVNFPQAAPITGTINQFLTNILSSADDIMDQTVTINQLWNEIVYSADDSSMDEESISDSNSVSSIDVESVMDSSSNISSDGESTIGSNIDDEVVLIMQFTEKKD